MRGGKKRLEFFFPPPTPAQLRSNSHRLTERRLALQAVGAGVVAGRHELTHGRVAGSRARGLREASALLLPRGRERRRRRMQRGGGGGGDGAPLTAQRPSAQRRRGHGPRGRGGVHHQESGDGDGSIADGITVFVSLSDARERERGEEKNKK